MVLLEMAHNPNIVFLCLTDDILLCENLILGKIPLQKF